MPPFSGLEEKESYKKYLKRKKKREDLQDWGCEMRHSFSSKDWINKEIAKALEKAYDSLKTIENEVWTK